MITTLLIGLLLAVGGAAESSETELLHALDLVRLEQYEAATEEFEKLCPLPMGDVSAAAKKGKLACELRMFVWVERSEEEPDPKSYSGIYWLAGDKAYKRGDLAIAEALLDVAVERDPNDAYNWHTMGLVRHKRGEYGRAVEAFKRSVELDPVESNTLYWLATALMDLGELDQASETLDRVLRMDPDQARVWFRRGEIFMLRGEYEWAIQMFKTAKKRGVRKKYVAPKIRECERLLGNDQQ